MDRKYIFVVLVVILALVSVWIFKTVSGHKKQAPEDIRQTAITRSAGAPVKGKIAIVLDDWGYNSSHLALLLKIKNPITVAILPGLRYSGKIARDAKAGGYETILHLPMESRGNEIPEKSTIYCSMSREEILSALQDNIRSVPGISGVNNHQGSRGTEDARVMKIILTELKMEKLFFVDSFTTARSVCLSVARKIGLRCARRDIFLDTPPSKLDDEAQAAYVRKQLYKLESIALRKGSAVGIGHDRAITLKVLREVMPHMEKHGIKFVFVSELTQ